MSNLHTFQVDITVLAPDRREAQRLMLANLKSKHRTEDWGVLGLVIHDGIKEAKHD